jgi:hypothetical protein
MRPQPVEDGRVVPVTKDPTDCPEGQASGVQFKHRPLPGPGYRPTTVLALDVLRSDPVFAGDPLNDVLGAHLRARRMMVIRAHVSRLTPARNNGVPLSTISQPIRTARRSVSISQSLQARSAGLKFRKLMCKVPFTA